MPVRKTDKPTFNLPVGGGLTGEPEPKEEAQRIAPQTPSGFKPAFDLTAPEHDKAGFFTRAAGGFALGVAEDPIVSLALEGVGVTPEMREKVSARLHQEGLDVGDVFQQIGELTPLFVGGLGAYNLGRKAATEVVKRGSKKTAKFLTQEIARTGTEEIIERAPLALVGGRALGGSLGIGLFETAEELAAGEELPDALVAGGKGALLTLGFEGALVGAGRAFGRGKTGLEAANIQRFEESGAKSLAIEHAQALRDQELALAKEVHKILPVKGTGRSLQNIAESRLAKKVVRQKKFKTAAAKAKKAGITLKPKLDPAELAAERALLINKTKDLGRQIKEVRTQRRGIETFIEPAPGVQYLTDAPIGSYSGLFSSPRVQEFLAKTAKAPETVFRQLGVTGGNTLRNIERAEMEMQAALVRNKAIIFRAKNKILKSAGKPVNRKGFAKDFDSQDEWLGIVAEWETKGEDGIRQLWLQAGRSADEAADAISGFNALDRLMTEPGKVLAQMGGPGNYSTEQLAKQGVVKYVPKMFAPMDETRASQRLAALGVQAAERDALLRHAKSGLEQFGTRGLHAAPEMAGTLKQQADRLRGVVNDDYFNAVLLDSIGLHKRIAYGKFLGVAPAPQTKLNLFDKTVKDLSVLTSHDAQRARLTQLVRQEGGDIGLFNTLLDIATGSNYYDAAMGSFADAVVSTQIAAKLPLAVIPNLSQTSNLALKFGLKQTAKQVKRNLGGVKQRDAMIALGIMDDIATGTLEQYRLTAAMHRGFSEGKLDRIGTYANRAARATLDYTGFSAVERWNRGVSAHVGLAYWRETLVKAGAGKLRGEQLAIRRRALRDLGVDLDDVIRKLDDPTVNATKLLDEIERRVAFKAMEQTQFLVTPSRRPEYWNTGWGRIIFQFKTFAFNQAKLMRDTVVSEAGNGNLGPLAVFLSVHPFAGEAVNDLQTLIAGDKQQTGVSRYLDNVMAVGGFGIVTDIIRSSLAGKTIEAFAGPTVSDLSQVVEAGARTLTGSGGLTTGANLVGRQRAVKVPLHLTGVSVLAGDALIDAIREEKESSGSPILTFEEFKAKNSQQ